VTSRIDALDAMTEDILVVALSLLLEHGAQLRLSKRDMDVFELGVHLGQAGTIEVLSRAHCHEQPGSAWA
jgi:hypothetical protein